ncbi:hypothetical protein EJB05_18084, partial [Eragrostis curvula]
MATVNNWLAFSLSPQELPPSQTESTLISATATDDVSSDVCFNIPQDWSMRGSELSALVAEPKLEDFLGGISFSEQHQKANSCNMIPSSSSTCYASSGVSTGYHHQLYHHPSSALQFADSVMVASSAAGVHDAGGGMLSAATNGGASAASGNGGSIGLSMIKNWLRSQPAPPLQQRAEAAADGAQAAAQALSLSMNMAGAQAAGMQHIAGERGRAPAESLSTSVQGGGTIAARKEDSSGSGGAGALQVAVSTDTGGSGASGEAPAPRKTVDTFGQRTSIYRGVTRHRWTGRYEAHLWDNSCRREGQTRKGRQGGYDKEDKAARAYDLAALKYWGPTTTTNFPVNNYEKELEEMKHMTRQEFVASLRRSASPTWEMASKNRKSCREQGSLLGHIHAAKRLKEAEAASAAAAAAGVVGYDVGRIASQLGADGAAAAALAYGAHYHHPAAAAWPTIAFQPAPAHHAGLYHPYAQPLRGWGCKQEQDHAVIAAAHSLQELHHLNLGAAGAHDFFSPAGAMHAGLGSIDNNASLEHSTGSNSVVYNSVGDSNGGGGGYMMPMNASSATTTAMVSAPQGDHHDDAKQAQMAYENYLVNAEAYGGGGRMSSWTPASAQPVAAAASSNDMAGGGVGHGGAQIFSVWNDT